MRFLLSGAVMLVCFSANSATVLKCIDAAGKVSFVQGHCPDTHSLEAVLAPENKRPGSGGKIVPMATPSAAPRVNTQRRRFNHCGDLTQVDIAHANANGKIILGMTGDDVKASWGSPSEVNSTASGQQWVYPIDEYTNRYLYVDPDGCFTYWN